MCVLREVRSRDDCQRSENKSKHPSLISGREKAIYLHSDKFADFHCCFVIYLSVRLSLCQKVAYAENVHIVLSCPNKNTFIFLTSCVFLVCLRRAGSFHLQSPKLHMPFSVVIEADLTHSSVSPRISFFKTECTPQDQPLCDTERVRDQSQRQAGCQSLQSLFQGE